MLQIYRPAPPIQWDWLALQGPDAADFLHRLTTVNVRAMQPGAGSPGFFLTAQGKIRAYFRLWRISGEEFFLELDAGVTGHWRQELLDAIEQFHFGEKFAVEKAPERDAELACAWVFGREADAIAPAGHWSDVAPGARVFNHGSVDFGETWLSAWGKHGPLDAWARALGAQLLGFEDVERMRIAAGRPRIDSELSHETIPLEAGLGEAVSENKGCYPGQEVIEKIISLGSPARRLARLAGSGPAPEAGASILAAATTGPGTGQGAAQEVGKVTSVIAAGSATESGFEALGFIRKTHAKEGLEIGFSARPGSRARIVSVAGYKPAPDQSGPKGQDRKPEHEDL